MTANRASIEEVKETERDAVWEIERFESDPKYMAFGTKVGGLDVFVFYSFIQNKLYMAKYVFFEKHSNDNLYISDYNQLNEILEKKYGKADQTDRFWKNDLYKDDPNDYGFAISLGHYALFDEWHTDKTLIFHALYGDNYKIEHSMEYQSNELIYLKEELDQKKDSDDF